MHHQLYKLAPVEPVLLLLLLPLLLSAGAASVAVPQQYGGCLLPALLPHDREASAQQH
jgi:hypothetical protein